MSRAVYQHCQLTDLNLFAAQQTKRAMENRVSAAKSRLERAVRIKEDGKPLWVDSDWQHTGKPLKIKRFFFVWKRPFMSPHDVIADAENRIEELDQRIALLDA